MRIANVEEVALSEAIRFSAEQKIKNSSRPGKGFLVGSICDTELLSFEHSPAAKQKAVERSGPSSALGGCAEHIPRAINQRSPEGKRSLTSSIQLVQYRVRPGSSRRGGWSQFVDIAL
jgi:hypothetical protein